MGFFGCFVGGPWKLFWVAFKPSWAVLGPLWGALGSCWGALGPSGGVLGAVIGRLGVILEPCRAVLGRLEAVWDPQAAQEAPEVTIHRPCRRSRASMCSEFEFWRAGGRNPRYIHQFWRAGGRHPRYIHQHIGKSSKNTSHLLGFGRPRAGSTPWAPW